MRSLYDAKNDIFRESKSRTRQNRMSTSKLAHKIRSAKENTSPLDLLSLMGMEKKQELIFFVYTDIQSAQMESLLG